MRITITKEVISAIKLLGFISIFIGIIGVVMTLVVSTIPTLTVFYRIICFGIAFVQMWFVYLNYWAMTTVAQCFAGYTSKTY